METRSQSQSGKHESNMVDKHGENHSTGKLALIKDQNLEDITTNASNQDSETHSLTGIIVSDGGVNAAPTDQHKGLVASRVEQINNTPVNSPTPTHNSKVYNKTKKKKQIKNGWS